MKQTTTGTGDTSITNRTGEYLWFHAEIEAEGSRSPSHMPESTGCLVSPGELDAAIDESIAKLTLSATCTVQGITRLCALYSTPERPVYARIESMAGKPVAYLVRATDEDFPPAFLRRQAS